MDMWRHIVENFQLIHVVGATGTPKMFETKDLIGAIIIGLLSATGSSLLTTRELAVKFQVFERQQIQTEVAQKANSDKLDKVLDQHRLDQLAISERITRLETAVNGMSGAMGGMAGMSGGRK